MRSVADERESFLGYAGEYHFALLSVRENLAGHRVDYFDKEVILIDMESVLALAVERYARSMRITSLSK